MSEFSTPWTYRKTLQVVDAAQTNSERQTGYGAYQVCTMGGNGSDFPTEELDKFGYLIAAAPEMLAALKKVVSAFKNPPFGSSEAFALSAAEYAISKAEGK